MLEPNEGEIGSVGGNAEPPIAHTHWRLSKPAARESIQKDLVDAVGAVTSVVPNQKRFCIWHPADEIASIGHLSLQAT